MIGNNYDLLFETPKGYSDENPNEWAIPYLMDKHNATEEDAIIYLEHLNFDPNNKEDVTLYAYLRFMTSHNFYYCLNIAKTIIENNKKLIDKDMELECLTQKTEILKKKNEKLSLYLKL